MASKIQKYLRYQKVQNVKIRMLEIDKKYKNIQYKYLETVL